MKGKKTGGRVLGTPNKTTAEIRQLIRDETDFTTLVKRLAELAGKGSIQAARILFEYGYGRPIQIVTEEVDPAQKFEIVIGDAQSIDVDDLAKVLTASELRRVRAEFPLAFKKNGEQAQRN